VANSGKLISAAEDCISAAVNNHRDNFNAALEQLLLAYQAINQSMETMWGRSKPADYINFRYVGQLREAPKSDPLLQILYLWYSPQGGR
jgi:hypothetical protein